VRSPARSYISLSGVLGSFARMIRTFSSLPDGCNQRRDVCVDRHAPQRSALDHRVALVARRRQRGRHHAAPSPRLACGDVVVRRFLLHPRASAGIDGLDLAALCKVDLSQTSKWRCIDQEPAGQCRGEIEAQQAVLSRSMALLPTARCVAPYSGTSEFAPLSTYVASPCRIHC
jgi:hypothetical protein